MKQNYFIYHYEKFLLIIFTITINGQLKEPSTGTPPLTRFFGPGENRVKGKPRYRRSILVLKTKNGEFDNPKSTFSKFLLV
jgi:hypothetical protein